MNSSCHKQCYCSMRLYIFVQCFINCLNVFNSKFGDSNKEAILYA